MSAAATEADAFDRRYRADPDPWSYRTSRYERDKYERTLAAIPPGRIASALEMGCSNGSFTELLAHRCDELLAVDFSAEAVRLARRRTAPFPAVTVEQRDLRHSLPEGRFDLVVCSEILYYWEAADVAAFCAGVPGRIRRGGSLVCVNWRGSDPTAPLDGPEVRELLSSELSGRLHRDHSEDRPGFLIDRWRPAER